MERIKHFPIPFFAVVMGLSGLAIAYQKSLSFIRIFKDCLRGVDVCGGYRFCSRVVFLSTKDVFVF